MNQQQNEIQLQAIEDFRRRYRTGVFVLLFTDLVDSTSLKQQRGDAVGSELISRHQSIIREMIANYPEAEEISTAGDSFFIAFSKPSDAVRFALGMQHALRELTPESKDHGWVRVGIHMGEVFIGKGPSEGQTQDVLGIHVDTAARVMSLAAGGQILLTRSVFDSARTILQGEAFEGLRPLSWLNHGLYSIKGVEEPREICEVGEQGLSPLSPPPDTDKARRYVAPGAEPLPGWRPAVGQAVPGSEWVLSRSLGEGGMGEVWLAEHRRTKDRRVFKFCFRADQLRSLKRELTIFRIIKQSLGERHDIARLYNVQFEEPPYYIELEYTPGGDLAGWVETRGGFQVVPLHTRLEVIAQIATALAAAHSVGVIHKDVKPSNILVENKPGGSFQVRLTDFGIGQLQDRQLLVRAGVTLTGFTEPADTSPSRGTVSGTRMYMAPELIAARPPSIQSDIYSLGVLFYQMMIGDLSAPLATDWERRIDDPLLREDIHACVAGDPADRLSGADELARRIRNLPQRSNERARREAAGKAQTRRRKLAFAGIAVTTILLLVAGALGFGLVWALKEKRNAERESYYATIGVADKALEDQRQDKAHELLALCHPDYRNWEWGRLQYVANLDMMTLPHPDIVHAVDWSPDGSYLATAVGNVWLHNQFVAKIWDTQTGKELLTLRGHTGPVLAVAYSPDGRWIATGSIDRSARIWDARTGELYRIFGNSVPIVRPDGHTAAVRAVCFSPDGRYLLTGEGGFENPIPEPTALRFWDIETSKVVRSIHNAHNGGVQSLVFSRDGARLLSCGADSAARVWDFESGDLLQTVLHPSGILSCARFSPDDSLIATAGYDHTARVWDAVSGELLHRFESDYMVRAVEFTLGGRCLAVTVDDETIRLFDLVSGEAVHDLTGHYRGVMCLALSPDRWRLASGSWDESAKVWNVDAARENVVFRHPGDVRDLEWSRDGQLLVTACYDGTVREWDARSNRQIGAIASRGAGVRSIAISPDKKTLVMGLMNGNIEFHDRLAKRIIRTVKAHQLPVTCLEYNDDGSLLVSTSGQKLSPGRGEPVLRIWDTATGKIATTIRSAGGRICEAAFSPDGRRVLSGNGVGRVAIWDVAGGEALRSFEADLGEIMSVAWSPDGQFVAAGGRNGTAAIWNAQTEEFIASTTGDDIAYSLGFTADGLRLATGSWEQTIRIWDATDGREILTLEGHGYAVLTVRFSPDGSMLASAGSSDSEARLWHSLPWLFSGRQATTSKELERAIAATKLKYWSDRRSGGAGGIERSAGHRTTSQDTFSAGSSVDVTLALHLERDETSVTVYEKIPPGWRVESISDRGQREGDALQWSFDDAVTTSPRVRYRLIAPAGADAVPVHLGKTTVRTETQTREIEPTSLAPAGAFIFQTGIYPDARYQGCEDAHIFVYRSDFNTGACDQIEEGDWNGGGEDHKKTLIRFDLSSVPTTFTLECAILRLYLFTEVSADIRAKHTVYAAPLLKAWGEGRGAGRDGETASRGDATFNSPLANIARWERPGALGLTDVGDVESSATAGADWPEWVEFDVTDSVRRFLAIPSTNYGWKISQDPVHGVDDRTIEYVKGAFAFKSSEAPERHLRPMLVLISEGKTTVP